MAHYLHAPGNPPDGWRELKRLLIFMIGAALVLGLIYGCNAYKSHQLHEKQPANPGALEG